MDEHSFRLSTIQYVYLYSHHIKDRDAFFYHYRLSAGFAFICLRRSHFYSYSFALKPDWTSMYPGRDELHQYFYSVAEKYNIIPHCRFNTMCKSLIWDSDRSLWICTFEETTTREVFTSEAAVVVSAIGTLDRPYIPAIEGADTFHGDVFHSARWNHSVNVKNKKILVLGNGASATQFVPELVKEVGPNGNVTQLVKSAHWWTKRVRSQSQSA